MNKTIITGIAAAALICGAVALNIWDYEHTVYRCSECGVVHKPTVGSYLIGMHTPKKRLLKCPICQNRSWHTRTLN